MLSRCDSALLTSAKNRVAPFKPFSVETIGSLKVRTRLRYTIFTAAASQVCSGVSTNLTGQRRPRAKEDLSNSDRGADK